MKKNAGYLLIILASAISIYTTNDLVEDRINAEAHARAAQVNAEFAQAEAAEMREKMKNLLRTVQEVEQLKRPVCDPKLVMERAIQSIGHGSLLCKDGRTPVLIDDVFVCPLNM